MPVKISINTRKRAKRRGSTFILVLGVTTLVSLFALLAISQQRIQRRMVSSTENSTRARATADAAIRIGLQLIANDSNWRTTYSNGNWVTNKIIASQGTYTIQGVDPYDADLADNVLDPLVLTGIGTYKGTVQNKEMTLLPKHKPLDCLNYAMCVSNQATFNSSTMRANHPLVAMLMEASSANIHANAEGEAISGSTYHKLTTTLTSATRPTPPSIAAAVQYYLDNGTAIDINALVATPENLGSNVGMENGTTDWAGSAPGSGRTCDLQSNSSEKHSGAASIFVSNRSSSLSGPVQLIDSFVTSEASYDIEVWVKSSTGSTETFKMVLYTKGTGSSKFDVSSHSVPPGVWTKLSATLQAKIWDGALEYAYFKIDGQLFGGKPDFYYDDFVITQPATGKEISKQLISPNHNPTGGATNAQGIYIIDCGGQDLKIKNSRILGTLVLQNPGGNTTIEGAMNWAPAVSGYPALFVTGNTSTTIALNTTRNGLNEKETDTNFNPTGASYPGLSDDTVKDDTYPSEISGLMFFEGEVNIGGHLLHKGTLLVEGNLISTDNTLNIEYDPNIITHTPPGFEGSIEWSVAPDAMRKTVN